MSKLPKKFKRFGIHGDLLHTVGYVTDGDKTIAVTKRWRESKQRWHYEADSLAMVQYCRKMSK